MTVNLQEAFTPPDDVGPGSDPIADINSGFGGKYAFLVPVTTEDVTLAATSFFLYTASTSPYGSATSHDLCGIGTETGVDGDYRALYPLTNGSAPITELYLMRRVPSVIPNVQRTSTVDAVATIFTSAGTPTSISVYLF